MFGRFRVEAVLAEGGMGRVYRALDTRLRRSVALKLLLVDDEGPGSARAGAVDALLREARAAAALQHPNIVVVHEAGEHEGQPFLIMELVKGVSLRQRLDEKPAPWRERWGWLVAMARALAFAHDAGVIHRDVKPENVVVDDGGNVKVLDFGIARLPREDSGAADTVPAGEISLETLSEEGRIFGTPYYMAPEQLRGEGTDARSDQFGWGTMAYELLAGVRPWSGDTALEAVSQILSAEPVPLAKRCPELPGELAEAVMRALEKEPSERYESMGALLAAVEPLVESQRAVEQAATVAMAAAPPAGPRRGRVAFAGLVVLVVAALGIGAWMTRTDRPVAQPTSSATAAPSSVGDAGPGIAVTDLPLPETSSPQALAEYKAGVQACATDRPSSRPSICARPSSWRRRTCSSWWRWGGVEGLPRRGTWLSPRRGCCGRSSTNGMLPTSPSRALAVA